MRIKREFVLGVLAGIAISQAGPLASYLFGSIFWAVVLPLAIVALIALMYFRQRSTK